MVDPHGSRPPDPEAARLDALARFGLMDSVPDGTADRVVALAASIAGTPMALVSLVDAERQWFKAAHGVSIRETPRRHSFCAHALDGQDLLEIPDALEDDRFRDNPLVTGDPHVRFYAGAPLMTRESHVLGTLCVLDHTPRRLTQGQRAALRLLAELVMEHFEYAVVADDVAREHRRLEEIVTGTNAATWEWHVPSGELRINRRWATMLGEEPEALAEPSIDTWRARVHPEDLPAAEAALSRHFAGTTDFFDCRLRMCHRNGGWVWVHTRGRLWSRRADDNAPVWMSGTHLDVTAEKEAEEALRLYASVFLASPDGIMITTPDHRILDVNPAYTRATGYERDEVIGTESELWTDPDNAPIVRALARDGQWRGERWARRRSGAIYPEQLAINRVADERGALSHYIAVFSDISHLKEYERRIRHLGLYDALTELPNRHLFASSLREAMVQARQRGQGLGVAILDIDHLQQFNSTQGKAAGDAVLREMATNLEQALGPGDLLARVGGDEFAVMLGGVADHGALVARLDVLHRAIGAPLDAAGGTARFTASAGATLFPLDEGDAEQLLRHASQAMYRAKQSGRDCTIVFDTDSAREVELRQRGLWRLREALAADEFTLHYQPRVDLVSGEVLGVEALLRWQHPDQGLQAPGEFLPLLEGAPLEHAVGAWVLRTAIAEGARHGLPVSVNVSARQLLAPDFSTDLVALLGTQPGFPATALELEILEAEAVYDWQAAQPVFAELRAHGVRFALDDFGTGYSSLVHLRHMPVEVLKIDVGFVRRMLESSEDAAIVESVVRLARSFELETVAEGVETPTHGERLVALGCRVGQGFGIARPMPSEELGPWLEGRPLRRMPAPAPPARDDDRSRPEQP
ncbi:sensor domain-containing phosphodiesterase [Spiribacter halobius]|nr:EAL domain-containing protein [Spiribacter halobius]UEX76678.1 EAL domain-containing protein [Spiribacter halobius]